MSAQTVTLELTEEDAQLVLDTLSHRMDELFVRNYPGDHEVAWRNRTVADKLACAVRESGGAVEYGRIVIKEAA